MRVCAREEGQVLLSSPLSHALTLILYANPMLIHPYIWIRVTMSVIRLRINTEWNPMCETDERNRKRRESWNYYVYIFPNRYLHYGSSRTSMSTICISFYWSEIWHSLLTRFYSETRCNAIQAHASPLPTSSWRLTISLSHSKSSTRVIFYSYASAATCTAGWSSSRLWSCHPTALERL